MTPEDYARLATDSGDPEKVRKVKDFLVSASARDIQKFIHSMNIHAASAVLQMARTSLEIRLAEDSEKTALRLEKHTKHLLLITYILAVLTIGLLVLTYVLVKHDDHSSYGHANATTVTVGATIASTGTNSPELATSAAETGAKEPG